MTEERWTSGDGELTAALRALYAAPDGETYWESLEARILARVSRPDDAMMWWTELVDMARPGLAAAAALILAASMLLVHSRQMEDRNAFATVVAPTAVSVEASARSHSVGDGDAAIHFLTPH